MSVAELISVLPSQECSFEILAECKAVGYGYLSLYPRELVPWEAFRPSRPMFKVLPNEIILQILSVLSADTKATRSPKKSESEEPSAIVTLKNFSLTCRAARILSREFLFRVIILSPYEQRGVEVLYSRAESLKNHGNHGIMNYVKCLDFRLFCPKCGLKSNGLCAEPSDIPRITALFKNFLTRFFKIPGLRERIKDLRFDTKCDCYDVSVTRGEQFGWGLVCYILDTYDFPALKTLSGLQIYQRYRRRRGIFRLPSDHLVKTRQEISQKPAELSYEDVTFWNNLRRCERKNISVTLKPSNAQTWTLLSEVFYDPTAKEIRFADDDSQRNICATGNRFTEIIFPLTPCLFQKDPSLSKLTKLEFFNVSMSSDSLISILDASPRLHTLLLKVFAITRGPRETSHLIWLPILAALSTKNWMEINFKMLYLDDAPHRIIKTSEVEQSALVTLFQGIWDSRLETAMSTIGHKIRGNKIICDKDILCNTMLYYERSSTDGARLAEGGYFKIVGCVE